MELITIAMTFSSYKQYNLAFGPFDDIYKRGKGVFTPKKTAVVNIVGAAGGTIVTNLIDSRYNNAEELCELLEKNLRLHGVDYNIERTPLYCTR